MNADGIPGVIGARSERMIGQHALQPGDGVAEIATSKPRRNFRVAEKRVGALGLRRMQVEFSRATEDMKSGWKFVGDDFLFGIVGNKGVVFIGEEQRKWIIARALMAHENFRRCARHAAEQFHAQQTAGARVRYKGILPIEMAVENTDHQAGGVNAQPGAAGTEISTRDDFWRCLYQARRCRWPVVMLVAVGGDNQRKILKHAKVQSQSTHCSSFIECSEHLQTCRLIVVTDALC